MPAPQGSQSHALPPGSDRLVAVALGVLALVLTVAALVTTLQSHDRMLKIALLYATALASAIVGVRFGKSRGMRSNGLKMLGLLTVLAMLTTVSIWSALGTWSLIGKCERREETTTVFMAQTTRVWYEGTACTEADRERYR